MSSASSFDKSFNTPTFISDEELRKSYDSYWDTVSSNPSVLKNSSVFLGAVEIFGAGVDLWGSDALLPIENPGGGRLTNNNEAKASSLIIVQGYRVEWRTAVVYGAMIKAAREAGIDAPLLSLTSGYRPDSLQKTLWNTKIAELKKEHPGWSEKQIKKEARKWVARPGSSPHRTGRALDFNMGISNKSANVDLQRKTEVYGWLKDNAVTYGFYNYPAEPWHWEYNPPAH